MLFKFNCEKCGVEKEVEVRVPRFCGNECRLTWLRETRKGHSPNINLNEENKMEEEIKIEEPTNEPDTNAEPEPAEDTGDLGSDTPAEDTVDAPSEPTEDTPGI